MLIFSFDQLLSFDLELLLELEIRFLCHLLGVSDSVNNLVLALAWNVIRRVHDVDILSPNALINNLGEVEDQEVVEAPHEAGSGRDRCGADRSLAPVVDDVVLN